MNFVLEGFLSELVKIANVVGEGAGLVGREAIEALVKRLGVRGGEATQSAAGREAVESLIGRMRTPAAVSGRTVLPEVQQAGQAALRGIQRKATMGSWMSYLNPRSFPRRMARKSDLGLKTTIMETGSPAAYQQAYNPARAAPMDTTVAEIKPEEIARRALAPSAPPPEQRGWMQRLMGRFRGVAPQPTQPPPLGAPVPVKISQASVESFWGEMEKISEKHAKGRKREASVDIAALAAPTLAAFGSDRLVQRITPGIQRSYSDFIGNRKSFKELVNPSRPHYSLRQIARAMGVKAPKFQKVNMDNAFFFPSMEMRTWLDRLLIKARGIDKYLPKKPFIGGRKYAPALAHELGHYKILTHPLWKRTLVPAESYLGLPAALAAVPAAILADPDSAVSKYAPAVALASGAPRVSHEALASLYGHQGLKGVGMSKQQLRKFRRGAALALSMYALPPVLLAGTALAAREVKKAVKKEMRSRGEKR